MNAVLQTGAVRTQDEGGTLVPTPEIPSPESFFRFRSIGGLDLAFLVCSSRAVTDRPASWRMPTPKQMVQFAKAAAVRENVPPVRTPGSDDEMPPQYWQAVLDDPRADAGPRTTGPSIRTQQACRHTAAPAAGRLPSLWPHRRDPKGRRRSAGRTPGRLERRRPAAARRYLPAAHRPPRRRWVLAVLRIVAGAAGRQRSCRMSGWPRNITQRPCRAPTARL
jgi:hypothetical protein